PETQRHYVPLGDLFLHFQTLDDNQVFDYERELDLSEAVVSISFKAGEVHYRRKIFASYPDGAIVIRLTADTPGQISFTARMGRERFRYVDHIRTEEGNSIIMSGNSGGGVNYCGVLMCKPEGGQMRTIGEHLVVTNADAVTLVISAATDFRESDPESASLANAKRAASRTYIDLLTAHIEDYSKLFQRTSLRLDAAFKAVEQDTSK
ncbi:glycoside hydrolase N-terminal domain-containing protein, partial [Paenibacillus sp. TAF58]